MALLTQLFRLPASALLLLLLSAAALGVALISQYAFGFAPCPLCIWQRVPYGVVIVLALLAYFMVSPQWLRGLLLLGCAVAFLVGAGIAFFHVGVEQHWWSGLESCSLSPALSDNNLTAQERMQQLLQTPAARCDEIAWTFLGLSMAVWNSVASLLLALYALIAANESQNPKA